MSKHYYWFAPADGVLGYGDERKVRKGVTHKVDGLISLCRHGLHASRHPLDALKHANSAHLWRVHLSGDVLHGDDKSCATERTYIARIDATDVLRRFARLCALDVVHLWDAPEVVICYLRTGDESIRAAAWDATWAATWAAARDAARAAAWDATRAAARRRFGRMVREAFRDEA